MWNEREERKSIGEKFKIKDNLVGFQQDRPSKRIEHIGSLLKSDISSLIDRVRVYRVQD